jgi:hypothetical protein
VGWRPEAAAVTGSIDDVARLWIAVTVVVVVGGVLIFVSFWRRR